MSVSAIVSNFNGARFLPRLLETLLAQQGVDLEIVVVNRESHDDSLDILRRHPSVKIVREPPETGLVAGYAAGVPVAIKEHFFFCNEDMWFEPDCLACLEGAIDLSRRIGAADPWQWTYDGTEWIHGGVKFRPARWAVSSPLPTRTYDFTVNLPPGDFVPFACAGAFLIHREIYAELGGWDTSFFLDDEDLDLFIRAWQRGWHCVTQPGAKVYHAVGASNAQTLGKAKQPVNRRRYVSARASKAIIPVKYFSAGAMPWALLNWGACLANNCLKLRPELAKLDGQAARQIVRRLPAALRFRRANALWNQQRPGELFFSHPEFLSGQ